VLVRLEGELPARIGRERLTAAGLTPLRLIPRIGVWVARPDDTSAAGLAEAVRQLEARGDVRWAEENVLVTAAGSAQETVPNDARYGDQWALPLIGAPEAWDVGRGMAVPIAIIDSGIDLDHGDLQSKLWVNKDEIPSNGVDDDGNGYVDDVNGYDLYNNDATPQDDYNHGSHVASIAGAAGNDGYGVAGVAWNTPLMAIKVLSNSGTGNAGSLAEAIIYAADNGARVINMSLGYTGSSSAVESAVEYARGRGCLLVAAAGNHDTSDPGASTAVLGPANLSGVVAVSATTAADAVAPYSNYGPQIDIAAPGSSILGCNRSGGWVTMSGTSMATPHVSGAAALLWGLHPELTADSVLFFLQATAVDIADQGIDNHSGAGRLDLGAAAASVYRLQQTAIPIASTP